MPSSTEPYRTVDMWTPSWGTPLQQQQNQARSGLGPPVCCHQQTLNKFISKSSFSEGVAVWKLSSLGYQFSISFKMFWCASDAICPRELSYYCQSVPNQSTTKTTKCSQDLLLITNVSATTSYKRSQYSFKFEMHYRYNFCQKILLKVLLLLKAYFVIESTSSKRKRLVTKSTWFAPVFVTTLLSLKSTFC